MFNNFTFNHLKKYIVHTFASATWLWGFNMTTLFWLKPSIFRVIPSVFRVSPSHFLARSFPRFWVSPCHFFSQNFPLFLVSFSLFSKSTLLIFLSQSFPFFGQLFQFFSSQCFAFWGQIFSFFWVGPSHCFESVLPIFSSQTFPFCLANIYLISSISFYSLRVLLEDVSDLWCQLKVYFSIKNWFKGDVNKLFSCKVYLHWTFRILNVYQISPFKLKKIHSS